MGRQSKLQEDLDLIRDQQIPATEYEKAIDELESMAADGVTIYGRIYRFTNYAEQQVGGRQTTELVGKVEELVDEDYVGRNFGSGKYKIRYTIKGPNDTRGTERNLIYYIGHEYDKYCRDRAEKFEVPAKNRSNGGALENFLNGLTADKITAFGLAIKTLKELFAPPPPPPQPDIVGLLTAFAGMNQPKPALSDSIVLSAMENLKQQNKPQSIIEQIRDFKQLKEELKEDLKEEDSEDEKGDDMNILVKTALEYLPMLLQRNNGNFQAVGSEAKTNPLVNKLIADDPELATKFIESAREKYGDENARELARGFGFEMQIKQDEGVTENV